MLTEGGRVVNFLTVGKVCQCRNKLFSFKNSYVVQLNYTVNYFGLCWRRLFNSSHNCVI